MSNNFETDIENTNTFDNSMTIKIEGITCSSCVSRVEKAVHKLGNNKIQVNLVTNTAYVEYNNQVLPENIVEVIEKLGYKTEITEISNTEENSKNIQTPSVSNLEEEKLVHQYENVTSSEKVKIPYKNFSENFIRSSFNDVVEEPIGQKTKNESTYSFKLLISIILTALSVGILIPLYGNSKIVIYSISIFSLIVSLWCGSSFHKNAYKSIKNFYLTMDSLVSLSVLSSLIWSFIQLTITANPVIHNHFSLRIFDFHSATSPLHFDSAMMITTFILLGRWIEDKSKKRGKQALQDILDLEVKHAKLVTKTNKTILTPIENIKVDDVVLVQNGEVIPTDGIIIEGETEINTVMLTGETLPKYVTVGDEVVGGTVNTFGAIKVKVTKTGKNTMLSQIIKSVLDSQAHKPKIQKLVDKIAGVFTPLIVFISISTTIVWILQEASINEAISITITMLVIACPCALGLATPMALIVSSGYTTRNGILVKSLETLEQLSKTNAVIFDKTGTVTTGELSVNSIEVCEDITENELAKIAYLAEQGSKHPISEAITSYVERNNIFKNSEEKTKNVSNHINYAGCGVEVTIDNLRVHIGKTKWIKNLGYELPEYLLRIVAQAQYTGSIVILVGGYDINEPFDTRVLKLFGIITFTDNIKENAKKTIQYLESEKIESLLATGDNERNAIYISNRIGIEEKNIYSELMPLDKKKIIQTLQEKNKYVAMVGDGINDAAALSQASIQGASFSFAHGSDLAVYASDITLLNSDIELISKTFKIAKKTMKIIKQNLLWAFAYNIVAIPVAAFGLINPSVASIAMVTSSIIVVTNSLRLQNVK
ncbi:cation-translocating P-type ATPase [Actinomyces sp. zg-332]|uniref:heavy metal translocating P-type ATPase n=1 Tax=Actinomyces sp. zg-332 TaxID=2708340 RepID=UPI00141F9984|nr:cation-translocating P-type ATPase [Actinomyces sp. zg-332]QPK94113.1 cation-translocating P-type ATPase [Actinomyces sp. zg-332]